MGLETAICTDLMADTEVAALVGTRVYKTQLPQPNAEGQTWYPAIVIRRAGGRQEHHQGGETTLAQAMIEIVSVSKSYGQAWAVSDAIRNRLADAHKRTTIGTGADVTTLCSVEREGDDNDSLTEPAPDGSTDVYHLVTSTYNVWYRVALPTG